MIYRKTDWLGCSAFKVPAAYSSLRHWILHWSFILHLACKFHFQDWVTHSIWSPCYGPRFWACFFCILRGNAAHTVVFQDSSFHRFRGLFPPLLLSLPSALFIVLSIIGFAGFEPDNRNWSKVSAVAPAASLFQLVQWLLHLLFGNWAL